MKPFYFFKITLIKDYRVRNTQGEVFLCKYELFFLIYLFIYSFPIKLYSHEVTMVWFIQVLQQILSCLVDDINNKT